MTPILLAFCLAALPPVVPAPALASGQDQLVIAGAVRDSATTLPLREARVIAIVAGGEGQSARRFETRAGEGGRFRLLVPGSQPALHLYASYLGRVSQVFELQTDADSAVVDLLITPATVSRVSGRAVDAGSSRPIRSALVALEDIGLTALTDATGHFAFGEIPPGGYMLVASHLAYRRRADSLVVEPSARLDVTVPLGSRVIELPPLIVTVLSSRLERVGFYQRQRSGAGVFITRSDIEKLPPTAMPSDLARTVRGTRLVRRPTGRGYRLVARNGCPYRYYVDDVRVGPTFELDDLDLNAIDGVEIYNGLGTIPGQYASVTPMDARACGVVVVWTRAR